MLPWIARFMRIAAREADLVAKEIEVGRYTFLLFKPALPSFLPPWAVAGRWRPNSSFPRTSSIHPSISLSLYNPTLFIPTPPSPANKVDGWVLGNGYFFPLTHVS